MPSTRKLQVLIKKIFRCVLLRRQKQQWHPLLALPVELLQQIAGYLALRDEVSFSLAHKSVCHAVGNLSWRLLTQNLDEKRAFLASLERDLPGLWFCPCSAVLRPKARYVTPRGFSYWRCDCDQAFIHYCAMVELNWPLIKLVKKRYLLGGDHGLPISNLAYRQRYHGFKSAVKGDINEADHEFTIQGRIVSGDVLIKTTYQFKSSLDIEERTCFRPCYHLRLESTADSELSLFEFLTSKPVALITYRQNQIFASRGHRANHVSHLKRCQHCATEYIVTAELSKQVVTVLIQVWQNLGSADSPDEEKWIYATGKDLIFYLGEPFTHSQLGSIRSGYENAGGILEPTPMHKTGPGRWYMPSIRDIFTYAGWVAF